MSRAVALTTTDNPYNPITDYDNWERFDQEKGYSTNYYLDRVCHTTRELGDDLYAQDIESAIDEIVEYDLISWLHQDIHYKKVVEESD